MLSEEIRTELFTMQDTAYRDFQSALIPSVSTEHFIGVRTPELRKYAKQLAKTAGFYPFLNDLPHAYFDENQLHAFLISEIRDFDVCIRETERFLPYVDNWATCDQMSPKVFLKHRKELKEYALKWIRSDHAYTIRFGICVLMKQFLGEDFDEAYPRIVADIRSDEYYVNMMRAWYFAEALAKRYEEVLPYIEEGRLDIWTHNRAIQKACESYRVPDERKAYLKRLKRKAKV